jgi:D-amino-acid dehydrogenase
MLTRTRRMLPGLRDDGRTEWMGFRPSFPDSLPVIARSARFANVYFAFGHAHRGLSFAAITGRLIADLMAGRTPAIDPSPYRADRF